MGVWDWQMQTDMCIRVNKDLLPAQELYSMSDINHNGKAYEKEHICMYN